MLTRQRLRYKIAIVGQVKDAITGEGIPDAIVKIVDAPDEFISGVIFKAKLLGLPGLQTQWRSLSAQLHPANKTLPKQIQDFQENLQNPQLNSADKLKLFQTFLEEPKVSDRHKFQGLQQILDYLPFNPKQKSSQPERVQTAPDGWFYFLDLPAGTYQLQAFLPNAGRYSVAQCKIAIGQEDRGNISKTDPNVSVFDKIRVELKLKPTTLLGKITSSDDSGAIAMAKVQIQGSRDYTFSASELTKQQQREWNYRVVGIEAGNTPLTVIVSARGYPTTQKEISLQTGEVKSLDFQLVPH